MVLGRFLTTPLRKISADVRKRVLSTLPTPESAPKQSPATRIINKVLNYRNEHGKRPRSPSPSPYFDDGGEGGDSDVVEVREVKRPRTESSPDADKGEAKGGPHRAMSDFDPLEVVNFFRVNTTRLEQVLPPSSTRGLSLTFLTGRTGSIRFLRLHSSLLLLNRRGGGEEF
jgi:hypothetical protein